MTDITAVLTCHNEGLLLGPSIASFRKAIEHARTQGIKVAPIIVVDKADPLTKSVVATLVDEDLCILETQCGDPGQTRNAAVAAARSHFISFLDGDDLWSFNWLTEAWLFSHRQPCPVICHSEMNIVFGGARQMWWHADSEAVGFDPSYLLISNYWDAMSFSAVETLEHHPFKQNNLADGYGHEDWHWNQVTFASGIPHRPVPDTVHFKRRRKASQMSKCDENDVITFPTKLTRFISAL